MHPTLIEIQQGQFLSNLKAIRQRIGAKVKFCLPVKANAYGHGLLGIARLAQPEVDYFGVSCLDEGIFLRQHSIYKPILVFGAIDEEQIPGLIAYDLEITISSLFKAKLVANYCQILAKGCKVHIKVDTGMNRVGIRPESFFELAEFVLTCSFFNLVGVYSHFAASDEIDQAVSKHQLDAFSPVVDYIKNRKADVLCHIANSAAICYSPHSYFDMVRPGLLSYGYFPPGFIDLSFMSLIRPCFSLKTKVSYFKVVMANRGISYNHFYHTQQLTRIVTLPIGYGDGYRRGLSNLGTAIIRGRKYPICGNVCMDMLMLDIGSQGEAYVGDEVVLIGSQGDQEISLQELADHLKTISYEVLVGFNERIPRIYVA